MDAPIVKRTTSHLPSHTPVRLRRDALTVVAMLAAAASLAAFLFLLPALSLRTAALASPSARTPAERARPLAIHITVTPRHLALLARLYTRVFDAHNLYLIDFAAPLTRAHFLDLSPAQRAVTHQRVAAPYTPLGVSHVINLLDAIAFFLDRAAFDAPPPFTHYVPLTPASYPLHQPAALRALLQRPPSSPVSEAPAQTSFFHLIHASQQPLFADEVDLHHVDNTLAFNHSLAPALQCSNLPHPDRRRRALPLARATEHFVLSHTLARFAADSAYAKRLLLTLSETSHVRHRFFASLALAAEADPIYLPEVVTGVDDDGGDERLAAAVDAATGRVARTADLHCVDSTAPDARVLQVRPDYAPRAPTVAFLRNASRPCLFAAPLDAEPDLHVRDAIDYELLIAPGTQGKPPAQGYDSYVRAKLDALTRPASRARPSS